MASAPVSRNLLTEQPAKPGKASQAPRMALGSGARRASQVSDGLADHSTGSPNITTDTKEAESWYRKNTPFSQPCTIPCNGVTRQTESIQEAPVSELDPDERLVDCISSTNIKEDWLVCPDQAQTTEEAAFCQWLNDIFKSFDTSIQDAFKCASSEPPIKVETLAELEWQRVRKNARLVHDLNFDRGLHLRPNLDGSRGQNRLRQADAYWRSVQMELELYDLLLSSAAPFAQMQRSAIWLNAFRRCQRRIPRLFNMVLDIVKTLIPENDFEFLQEVADVSLNMDQIERSAFSLARCVELIVDVLKSQCAPSRDHSIEQLRTSMQRAVRQADNRLIVQCLASILSTTETMKLDLANHYIHSYACVLVEESTALSRQHFSDKLARGRIDVHAALSWYRDTAVALRDDSDLDRSQAGLTQLLASLTHTLTSCLRPDQPPTELPQTFRFDYTRLEAVSSELQNVATVVLYAKAVSMTLMGQGCPASKIRHTTEQLSNSILAILTFKRREETWTTTEDLILTQIESVMQKNFSDMATGEPATFRKAVLSVVHPTRDCTVDGLAQQVATMMETVLWKRVRDLASRYASCSPAVQMDALTAQRGAHHAVENGTDSLVGTAIGQECAVQALESAFEGMARRVAHVAILHWRVWGPLLYAAEGDS